MTSALERLGVRSQGMELHAERWGTSGVPVVLGHGFGGSARNFRPQARALVDVQTLVAFDARGHARSAAPHDAASYEPECFVHDVGAVLDAAGWDSAVIGGLSMGAGVALRFALAHPERTRALVLAAFPRSRRDPGHVDWATSFAQALRRDGLEVAGREHVWGELSRYDAKAADLVRRGFAEHDPLALAHVLERLLAVQPGPDELRDELARVSCPTLIVVGSADQGSLGPSRALAGLISGSVLVEVQGGGHVINLERPDEFNRALRAFLADARRA